MTTVATTTTLAERLRATIVEEIPDVQLIESPSGSYYTVKLGKATLGYVNGTKKLRVDWPRRNGVREQTPVTAARDVAKVVRRMRTFIPPEVETP